MKKLKGLREKRNEILLKMDSIANGAIEETRALSDEEKAEFDRLEEEVRALNDTIERCEKEYEQDIEGADEETRAEYSKEKADREAFVNFIRNGDVPEEQRADTNFTKGDNTVVLNTTVAKTILEKVKDRCNIYNYASKFNVGGTLTFPVYDETNGDVTMAYAEEFGTLEATGGKFISISLTGYLAAAKALISKSLINNSNFDVFGYVTDRVAQAIADFVEKELLKGTANKIEGLSKAEVVATTLNADSLIDVQDSVKSVFQPNARWIMNGKTKNIIRKLKDGQGNYLLERSYAQGTGNWTLLGKPVDISDEMADNDIFYGDFSGLAIKISEAPSIDVLREKYSEQHAIGLTAWIEIDSKILEPQKIRRLTVSDTTGDTEESGTTQAKSASK